MEATRSSNGGASQLAPTPVRACNISGCQVNKLVHLTKRNCSQFVTAPYIMPKPLIVSGKTSIFQVGGEMAKIGDVPSISAASGDSGSKPIYRIKPGTHAHIINYVFVDEDSDSLEKANSEDEEAMRMLLNSQRESAQAKLQKLISSHRGVTTAQVTAAPTNGASKTVTSRTRPTSVAKSVNVTTPQIHPNLSIASVEGALPLPAERTIAKNNTAAHNRVDKLQAEILSLRRTVAKLSGTFPPK